MIDLDSIFGTGGTAWNRQPVPSLNPREASNGAASRPLEPAEPPEPEKKGVEGKARPIAAGTASEIRAAETDLESRIQVMARRWDYAADEALWGGVEKSGALTPKTGRAPFFAAPRNG